MISITRTRSHGSGVNCCNDFNFTPEMKGMEDAPIQDTEYANLATVAKMYGKMPHEIAFAENDSPTYRIRRVSEDEWIAEPSNEIPMAKLIIDMQCAMEYAKAREKAIADAQKR